MNANSFDAFELKLGMNSRDPLFMKRLLVLAEFSLKPTETFRIHESFFDPKINEMFKCFFFVKVFIAKTGILIILFYMNLCIIYVS